MYADVHAGGDQKNFNRKNILKGEGLKLWIYTTQCMYIRTQGS